MPTYRFLRKSQGNITSARDIIFIHATLRRVILLSEGKFKLANIAHGITQLHICRTQRIFFFFERVTYNIERVSTSYKVSVTRASIFCCSFCRNRPTEQILHVQYSGTFSVLSFKKKNAN